jgi:septal ring factor EnvC (AmiA/AmiB activator)
MLSPILLAVSVALAAVFALLAILSARRCSSTLTQAREIVSSIRSLRGKVEVHDTELDAVTDAIAKLRGKFYAERRKSQQTTSSLDSPEDPIGAGTVDVATLKAQLRRKVGLVAGQPAPHQ